MIPMNWKKMPLIQVAFVQTGIAKGARKLKDPVELPYLRVANVQDGFLDLSQIKAIQLEKAQIDRYLLKIGDVLLTEGGDFDKLGRGTVWKGQIEKCVHQNHVFVARPKPEVLLSDFLSLLTGSSYGKLYFKKCSKQSTNLASINSTQLKKFPVLLPPLPEQHAIITLLSAWNLALEKTDQLVVAKERQQNALTQDLLTGNKRIKGYFEKWRKFRLSEVLIEHGEHSTGKEAVFSVSVHKGLVNQIEHLGRVFSAKDTSNYNLVKPGDVVYTKSPTGDFPYGIVKQSRVDFPVIVSPLYGVFTPRSQQLGTFLGLYFESPVRTRNYLYPIIQKGAKNTINITNSTFLSNSLYLPSCDEETKAIADILNAARQEIDLLKKQAEAFRRQKRGLMQKLLTGEWRVKVG